MVSLYKPTDAWIKSGKDLDRAKRASQLLKDRISSTPLLRHTDRTKPYVIIVHANVWAIGAALSREYDGGVFPVRFTGHMLHGAEPPVPPR